METIKQTPVIDIDPASVQIISTTEIAPDTPNFTDQEYLPSATRRDFTPRQNNFESKSGLNDTDRVNLLLGFAAMSMEGVKKPDFASQSLNADDFRGTFGTILKGLDGDYAKAVQGSFDLPFDAIDASNPSGSKPDSLFSPEEHDLAAFVSGVALAKTRELEEKKTLGKPKYFLTDEFKTMIAEGAKARNIAMTPEIFDSVFTKLSGAMESSHAQYKTRLADWEEKLREEAAETAFITREEGNGFDLVA